MDKLLITKSQADSLYYALLEVLYECDSEGLGFICMENAKNLINEICEDNGEDIIFDDIDEDW